MDEARVGLIPTYRAIWAKRGQRPVAPSRRRYEWRYDYAFVHPGSGDMVHFVCSSVDTDLMSAVLKGFADQLGLGPERHVVLVLDGAGWHRSKDLRVPTGLHLVILPAYSPELQPVECLFPLINEALANRSFDDIEDLERVLTGRIGELMEDPLLVSDRTRFHWWPDDVKPVSNRLAS